MKEFLEKRWWGGVGVIIALMLGLPALIQYLGKVNISWLAITIALSVVLATALSLVAIWNVRLRRKYEDARSQMKKIAEFLETLMEEKPEDEKEKIVLLPDIDHIWKLNIDNALLTQLCGQAHGLATVKYHDAKLHSLSIHVHPYTKIDYDRVSVFFTFYSRWADRQCVYITSELRRETELLSDRPAKSEMDRMILNEMPWLRDNNWPEFLRKACEKVGPLSTDSNTVYYLSTRTPFPPFWKLPWSISFTDGVTGNDFGFSWDGKGELIPDEVLNKELKKELKALFRKIRQLNE